MFKFLIIDYRAIWNRKQACTTHMGGIETQLECLEWMLWAFTCVYHLETTANTMMAENAKNSRAKRWVAIGLNLMSS